MVRVKVIFELVSNVMLTNDQAICLKFVKRFRPISETFEVPTDVAKFVTESPWHRSPISPHRLALTSEGQQVLADYEGRQTSVSQETLRVLADAAYEFTLRIPWSRSKRLIEEKVSETRIVLGDG